eukprot:scaffold35006_cov17-Tisochrysis_lutea.AAC.1
MGTFGKTMRRIMPAIIDTCLLLPKEECDIKYSCATTRVHVGLRHFRVPFHIMHHEICKRYATAAHA